MRRWRVSIRLSLLVVVPALVVATGVAIAAGAFSSTRDAVDELAADLFRGASQSAADRARTHLLRAVPAVEIAPLVFVDDDTDLARRLVSVLRANPEFSWVSYSAADGRFTGASRTADGSIVVNQSEIRGGKTSRAEHDVLPDGTWRPRARDADTGYDPRTRPFYRLAAAKRRRVWTPPYVFFGSGVPGITCASPRLDAAGAVLGVFTVDFDLNALSKGMRDLRIGHHGRAFIVAGDGTVLAHPTVHLVEQKDAHDDGHLVMASDVEDPALRAWSVVARDAGAAAGEPFRFAIDGEPWLGSRISVPIDADLAWDVGVVAPESDFLGAVERSRRTALVISSAALVAALVLSLLLANRIARPLESIAARMEEAGQLRLGGAALEPSLFSEVERMREALGKMRGGLQSFSRYVPADLVRRVLASGREAVLGASTTPLTVVFTDIASFTTVAERMPPDELVTLLGAYFDEATRVVSAGGGTIDKFIGDAVMAFWGAPEPDPRHAANACSTVIRLRDSLRAKAAAGVVWAAGFPTRFGVATGSVVVGNVGATERMNYTALGDPVNLAARLESLNKAYGTAILASDTTVAEAGAAILSRPIDVVVVKGRRALSTVHELLGVADQATEADREAARLFREALEAYVAGDFARSAGCYDRASRVRPDPVASLLRERAHRLAAAPLPKDWDGVTLLDQK